MPWASFSNPIDTGTGRRTRRSARRSLNPTNQWENCSTAAAASVVLVQPPDPVGRGGVDPVGVLGVGHQLEDGLRAQRAAPRAPGGAAVVAAEDLPEGGGVDPARDG